MGKRMCPCKVKYVKSTCQDLSRLLHGGLHLEASQERVDRIRVDFAVMSNDNGQTNNLQNLLIRSLYPTVRNFQANHSARKEIKGNK